MVVPSDIYQTNLSPIVEMFELSNYDNANSIFRFCNTTDLTWQGHTYQALPCEVSGFEFTGSGALPRPTIRISNVGSIVSSLIALYNDLIGARLTRKRTLAKYLDGQPTADRNAFFADDIWYVERKTLENDTVVEWELSSSLDLEGLQLPRRVIVANTCSWVYRSASCGYAGGAAFDSGDVATTDMNQDICGKRVSSCKLRFGTGGVLPYGGFPGVTRL